MVDFQLEWTTVLTWLIRIALPIVFFWIYFKPYRTKEEDDESDDYGRPALHQKDDVREAFQEAIGPDCYSRRRMLAHRKVVADCPPPESLGTVGTQARASEPQRPAKPKKKAGKPERSSGEEKGAAPPRRSKLRQAQPESSLVSLQETPASAEASKLREADAKLQLASLLNYLAIEYKEPQRHFLMAEGISPPPPPRTKRSGSTTQEVSDDIVAKKNEEAQHILEGALRFKSSHVARAIHQQLTNQQVDISESNYTLMIETAVAAADLKCASDLLMKMETAGGCPTSELLDKVMDLYALQKSKREQQRQATHATSSQQSAEDSPYPGQVLLPLIPNEDFIRSKLSTKAVPFIPASSTAEATTGPQVSKSSELQSKDAGVDVDADADVASAPLGPDARPKCTEDKPGSVEKAIAFAQASLSTLIPEAAPTQRTKLVSSAKPFEPNSYSSVGYDYDTSYSYGWPVNFGPTHKDGSQTVGGNRGRGAGPFKQKKSRNKGQ